jgi:hypothetical protein
MYGWIEHVTRKSPLASNVRGQDSPSASSGPSQLPSAASASCSTGSRFTHVTVVPASISRVCGWYPNPWIVTVTPAGTDGVAVAVGVAVGAAVGAAVAVAVAGVCVAVAVGGGDAVAIGVELGVVGAAVVVTAGVAADVGVAATVEDGDATAVAVAVAVEVAVVSTVAVTSGVTVMLGVATPSPEAQAATASSRANQPDVALICSTVVDRRDTLEGRHRAPLTQTFPPTSYTPGIQGSEAPMHQNEVIADGLSRGRGGLRRALQGMTPEVLQYRPADHTNPIGWLAWHIARVEDMHVADLLEQDQLWTGDGWHERFGMPPDARDFGTRQTLDQVNAVNAPNVDLILGYYDAVAARTDAYLEALTPEDLARVLDEPQFQPLPTVGVRINSLIHHAAHHAGQIDYLRGLRDPSLGGLA